MAHVVPARVIKICSPLLVSFGRTFGINPFPIWDDKGEGFMEEYEEWNQGYDTETTELYYRGVVR